mgnify:CR=1 FL=1
MSRESAAKINDGLSMLLAHQRVLGEYANRPAFAGDHETASDIPLPVSAMLGRVSDGNEALLALMAASEGGVTMPSDREARLARSWRKGVVSYLAVMAVMTDAKVSSRVVSSKQRARLLRAVERWRKAVAVFRQMPVTEVYREPGP